MISSNKYFVSDNFFSKKNVLADLKEISLWDHYRNPHFKAKGQHRSDISTLKQFKMNTKGNIKLYLSSNLSKINWVNF